MLNIGIFFSQRRWYSSQFKTKKSQILKHQEKVNCYSDFFFLVDLEVCEHGSRIIIFNQKDFHNQFYIDKGLNIFHVKTFHIYIYAKNCFIMQTCLWIKALSPSSLCFQTTVFEL